MTGDSMKQSLLTAERQKSDKCQPASRRKLTKNVNGSSDDRSDEDEESNQTVSLSTYHHLLCTKSPSEPPKLIIDMSSPCETDHIYAVDVKKEEMEQLERLKEMLLLQLDLIQHQQEQILKKDRQLVTLKQEKESLKVRLERMERRLSLLRHKKESSQSDTDDTVLSSTYMTVFNSAASHELNTPPEKPFSSRAFRPRSYRRQGKGAFRGIKRHYFRRAQAMSIKKFMPSPSPGASASNTSTELPQSRELTARDDTNKTLTFRQRRGGGRRKESILRTDKLYYMSVNKVSSPPGEPPQDKTIEVPSWRYHPITSCYQMEGTEDIDDDVFYRRHVKLENDERRRKRWDIQRIREQRIQEKLHEKRQTLDKEGHQKQHSKKYKITSFFPDVKDVHAIEVSDMVPVVAFGQTIPIFQSSEFSLPWYDPRENQISSSSKKSQLADNTVPKRAA